MIKSTFLLLCLLIITSAIHAQITLVKEINPIEGSDPNAGFVFNNAFYFSADENIAPSINQGKESIEQKNYC